MASKPSELVLLDHNFDLHLGTLLDFRGRILVWNKPRHPSVSCDDAMDGRTLNSGFRDSTLEGCGSGNTLQRPTSHPGFLWLTFRVYHPYLDGVLILPKDTLIVRAG